MRPWNEGHCITRWSVLLSAVHETEPQLTGSVCTVSAESMTHRTNTAWSALDSMNTLQNLSCGSTLKHHQCSPCTAAESPWNVYTKSPQQTDSGLAFIKWCLVLYALTISTFPPDSEILKKNWRRILNSQKQLIQRFGVGLPDSGLCTGIIALFTRCSLLSEAFWLQLLANTCTSDWRNMGTLRIWVPRPQWPTIWKLRP